MIESIKKDDILALIKNSGMTGDRYIDMLQAESTGIIGHYQPYYSVFYQIAKFLKPAFSVELGSWRGFAACSFAAGSPKGKVVTIDIHREDKVAQSRVIEHTKNYNNLIYINDWTWNAVDRVTNVGLPIDILFIDAWHTYEYANKEWELYRPLLADNALVICDDIFDAEGACENMIMFWDKAIKKDKEIKWNHIDASIHPGIPMGFAYYKRKYEEE